MTTDQEETSILTDFSSNKPILAIFFAGIGNKGKLPHFSFYEVSSKINTNKIFVRDIHKLWYHKGLPGIAKNIDEIALYLFQYTQDDQFKRIIFIGNSMGGYAALLLGTLLSVNTVIAFCPKTFISPAMRFFSQDWSNWRQVWKLFWLPSAQRKYFDLKSLLKRKSQGTHYHIYYSTQKRIDKLHVLRIKEYQNITLHSYNIGGHGLVKHLRNTHKLRRILQKHIQQT